VGCGHRGDGEIDFVPYLGVMKKVVSLALKVLVAIIVILLIAFAILYTPDISVDKLKGKYQFQDSQWITIDDVDIHYRKVGQGPPIVMVHGFGGNLRNWEGWTEELQDSFTTISFDLPGYGLTGATPAKDYSDERQIAYLKDFVDAVGIDSFTLAGNSMGGGISWKYALTYPQDVTDLVLVDASGYRSKPVVGKKDKTPIGFKLLRIPILKSVLTKITPKSIIRKSLENTYHTPDFVTDEEVEIVRDLMRRPGSREVLFSRMNGKRKRFEGKIEDLPMRTLIMWGDQDHIIPVEHAANFDSDIRNSDLVIYKGIGHLPMDEIPEKTAGDLREWLEE